MSGIETLTIVLHNDGLMMSDAKTWFVRGLKTLLRLVVVSVLLIGGCWITRPSVPVNASKLQAETVASPQYRAAADSATFLFKNVSRELKLPSVSIAVSVGDELIWSAAFGWADVSAEKAAGLGTRYRAGSVSKSMTGLVAAKLVAAGKLDLDKPVHEYLPNFPEKRWAFTPRQLGAHTAGIRHYAAPGETGFFAEQFSSRQYASVGEALEIFRDDPLLFEPGAGFQYSTHGFTLLSAVLQKAANKDFLDLVNETIWRPQGMKDTRPDDFSQEDPERAVPYTAIGGRLFHWEGPNPSYKWAGGGILTAPTDLVRMGGAFLTDRVVSSVLCDSLIAPIPLANGAANPQGYALGWRVQKVAELLGSADSLRVLHHGGSSPGGSSFLLLVPSGKVAAAAMTNLSLSRAGPLRRAVFQIAGLFRDVALNDMNSHLKMNKN